MKLLADLPPQFLAWDGPTGTSRSYWNRGIKLAWTNPNVGDWIDAKGIKQGPTPWASARWAGAGTQALDLGALVAKQLPGENRGFLLQAAGTNHAISFAGRKAVGRPTLQVTTTDGVFNAPVIATPYWAMYAGGTTNGQSAFTVQKGQYGALLQFDYSGITGQLRSAVLTLTTSLWKRPTLVHVFECDPPAYRYVSTPVSGGFAAQYRQDAGIAADPRTIFASDFTDMAPWDSRRKMANAELVHRAGLPELRCRTPAGENSGVGLSKYFMRGVDGVEGSPPTSVLDEAYFRYYLTLEDDWRSEVDANKTPGFDCRMGVWQATNRWQPTGGNGGTANDGRHERWTRNRHAYNGHMVRGHSSQQVTDGNPYSEFVWLGTYNYNIDQAGDYGEGVRWSNIVARRGERLCIEWHMRMNSLTGEPDASGNREAVHDGLLETWVNGVQVMKWERLRWRRHPQLGVASIDLSMYHGGKKAAPRDMHCRWGHVVVAREYIGPMA